MFISAKCDSPSKFENYLRELLEEYISKNSLKKEEKEKEKRIRLNDKKYISRRNKRSALYEIFTWKNIFRSMFSRK